MNAGPPARGGVPRGAAWTLFPHLDALIAYRLLFGIYSGIVPDGIADLVTGDIDWAGDSTILLSYVKGRTAAESLNLPAPGGAAAGAVAGALGAAARASLAAGQRDHALAGHEPARDKSRLVTARSSRSRSSAGSCATASLGDDGQPLKIHRAPDPHHPPGDAGQARLDRQRAGRRSTRTTARRSRATTT